MQAVFAGLSTCLRSAPVPHSNVALRRLDRATEEIQPSHVFALFSGGHDSLVSTFIAAQHPQFTAAVHINTGIGVPETRDFVIDTCREHGWKLLEYNAAENTNAKGEPDPQIYDELVLAHGFPGPNKFGHGKMYARLKERQIRRLIREHKTHRLDRIILVSGCRSQESLRRMGNVEEVQRDGCRVWVAPIHDWSKLDVERFIKSRGLKPNPVVRLLSKSGECLCGAFAKKGELAELEAFYPEVAARIRDLERRVMRRFPWGWEEGPPDWWVKRNRRRKEAAMRGKRLPMCMSCDKRFFDGDTDDDARLPESEEQRQV